MSPFRVALIATALECCPFGVPGSFPCAILLGIAGGGYAQTPTSCRTISRGGGRGTAARCANSISARPGDGLLKNRCESLRRNVAHQNHLELHIAHKLLEHFEQVVPVSSKFAKNDVSVCQSL